jgi:tRNA threonylcarbamoyladenosine biosynthesis protein TsaB
VIKPVILAIDTSSRSIDAAVASGANGQVFRRARLRDISGRQAEMLPLYIQRLMQDAGIGLRDLSRIVVVTGPGAFTGVRVGAAFAKGVAVALGVEALGISSLECLARQSRSSKLGSAVGAVTDAGRGEVFFAVVNADGTRCIEPQLASYADAHRILSQPSLAPLELVGSGRELIDGFPVSFSTPNQLACLAATLDPLLYPADPTYLREPDAKLPS